MGRLWEKPIPKIYYASIYYEEQPVKDEEIKNQSSRYPSIRKIQRARQNQKGNQYSRNKGAHFRE
jgi:hypothetical protein